MVFDTADKTRPALDLRQAIALRALACGLGWPGVCRGELQRLGLVDGDELTDAGRATVEQTPEYLHEALVRMAYRIRQQTRGHDDGE
jgi:hypothetical protein